MVVSLHHMFILQGTAQGSLLDIVSSSASLGMLLLPMLSLVPADVWRYSLAFGLTLFMSTWCQLENARRDKIVQESGSTSLTEEQMRLESELADNVPWFRYTV